METTSDSKRSGNGTEDRYRSKNTFSVASSFPFELVEAILRYVPVPDLMVAAANVPKFWREVIENSKKIWKRIARYSPQDDGSIDRKGRKRAASLAFSSGNPHLPWNFNYPLLNGILYVHRRTDGAEGFIFAPISEKQTLRVLDPGSKTAK